jgi:unspecific monooxygenase
MTSTTDPPEALLFNPFDPAFRADPYSACRRLRELDPVHEHPLGFTVLTRYADCSAILRHPNASSDSRKAPGFREQVAQMGLDPDEEMQRGRPFLFRDPPDHTRLRGLVSKAFTPRVIEGLRPRIEAIVAELIDATGKRGSLEVIEDLAYPLPVIIISEMLGVPAEDHGTFSAWSRELARSLDPDFALPPEVQERRKRAAEEFREYFARLIARRRQEPRADLVSALIAAEDEGQKLSESELLETCVLLLIAGHETTVNLIGNGALALLRNPDQLQLLRDDASLIKPAVEEVLRYDPPVQLTGRLALADIDLGDAVIPAGRQTVMLIAGANRDPAQFPDPDRLDIRREDNRHLAFGMGVHFCLGAPLARVEGQIALLAFAQRLDAPEIAGEAVYKENITLRGLQSLPVKFGAVR